MLRELRYALRRALFHRGASLAAVVSLAIGIGATATTLGWVDQMLVRPLPGTRDAASLSVLLSRSVSGAPGNISHPDYVDIRAAVQPVADVAATSYAAVTFTANRGEPSARVFAEPMPLLYIPALQWYRPDHALHVRTTGAARILPDIRRAVLELDSGVTLFNTTTLAAHVEASTFIHRFGASLSLALAVPCLLLTGVGVYSVLAHTVTQRTTEIGLRVALGAQRADIARMIARHAVVITITGVAMGLAAGFSVASVLSTVLIDVERTDAVAWIAGTVMASGVAMLAGLIATARATRIGPSVTIRRGPRA